MSKVQTLRCFVRQRLSAAAEEIFGLFERTIAEYEEELCRSKEENERQQKILDAVLQPEVRLHRADVQQLLVSKEEVRPELQEWRPSQDQKDPPESSHVKEEQEEIWTSQEGEQLHGPEEADITKFPLTPLPVKSEEGDEEKPQSSQLHQSQTEEDRDAEDLEIEADGEDCEGSEPAQNSDPDSRLQPATVGKTSQSSESEMEETREPQSGLNLLQNNEVPVSDVGYNTRKTSVSSSERPPSFDHKEHPQTHIGIQTEGKPFSCSVCGRRYRQKRSLTTHMRLHSEGQHVSCSVCKKTFPKNINVVRHMRIHTGEKPFTCSVCKTSFSARSILVNHMRIHTGEKPFSCSVCGKSFSRRDHLRQHSKVHTGEKPFKCSVCGKEYARKYNLRHHMTGHRGEKQVPLLRVVE